MCGESAVRTSQGGAIACLCRCFRESLSKPFERFGKIVFSDVENNGIRKTSVSLADCNQSNGLENCVLMIHQDGSLLGVGAYKPHDALHCYPISWSVSRNEYAIEPQSWLPLAVGGAGIIGRRVTLFDPVRELNLAEGIVGRN